MKTNEDILPYFQRQKCSPTILVSGDIRFMVLFAKNPTSNILSCVSTESDLMQRDQRDVT